MATVPDTHTFVNGILDSSELNTYIRDVLRFYLDKPVAELRQIVTQSLANGTWTAITFTTEDIDDDPSGTGGHSNTTNTSRYTAQYAGWYLVSGAVTLVTSAVGDRGTRWAVNGTPVPASDIFLPGSTTAGASFPARTKRIFLNVGDYVELFAWQNTGGLLNTVAVLGGENASSMSVAWERNA